MAKLYWRIKKNGKWTWEPAYFETYGVRSKVPGVGSEVLLWWPEVEEE